jgi:glutamate racemase
MVMVRLANGYTVCMTIGVFDSGIGGEAVAASLQGAFPSAVIHTVNDHEHVPYGNRGSDEIIKLTDTAIQPLLKLGCDVIILACNSATAAAIEWLRGTYPEQSFIGLEPMIKPAGELTKAGTVAVLATPATLHSDRYSKLKEKYAGSLVIIEPDCSTWASMIEHDVVDTLIVRNTVEDVCEQGADVIVLACTHYHWIRETIEKAAAGRATVLDPSEAIARRVQTLLQLS